MYGISFRPPTSALSVQSGLVTFACVAALTSCSDDDETTVKQGFRVDGEKYSLSKAYTYFYDESDEEETLYSHQVYLTGGGLTMDTDEFSGSGDLAAFSLWSDSEELEAGEYAIRDSPDGPGEASLVGAYVDFSAESNDYTSVFAGTGATITVSKSDDSYTFKVRCPTVLTIITSGSTWIYLPVDGDLQLHYSGELTDISDDDLRKPGGRTKLFLP